MQQLAKIYRGEKIESIHYGHAILADETGHVLHSMGDEEFWLFPRSAFKLFQALALFESGAFEYYKLPDCFGALACASHWGESYHLDAVEQWLKILDLNEHALACGDAYPRLEKDMVTYIQRGGKKTPKLYNCSGKHLGFLTTALYKGWDIKSYESFNHPVQQFMRELFSQLSSINAHKLYWGIDGCAMATPYIKAVDLAKAYANLASGIVFNKTSQTMHQCITVHPAYLGGGGDLVEVLPKVSQGDIVVKPGAEGVYAGYAKSKKWGFVVKCLDGNLRGAQMGMLKLLEQVGILPNDERLVPFLSLSIKNSIDETIGFLC